MKITIFSGQFDSPLHGGEYAATGPNGPFPAWCAEQTQSLSFGEKIDYQVIDGIDAWGAPISQALDRLMSWTVGAGWPTTLDQNDAIQTDIWSILSGRAGMIYTEAAPITQHSMLLHSATKQDLLVTQPISEPHPLPMLLIGIALLAAYRSIRT